MRTPVSVSRLLCVCAVLATPKSTVRAIQHRSADPADHNLIFLYSADGYDDGLLNWQKCAQCRTGRVLSAHEKARLYAVGARQVLIRLSYACSAALCDRRAYPRRVWLSRWR
jgi:hypothetical protein